MRQLTYAFLTLISLGSIQLAFSCPFNFNNNFSRPVAIVDYNKQNDHYVPTTKAIIQPGETQLVPGIRADREVWVYVQNRSTPDIYNPFYNIIEDECAPEGAPIPTLNFKSLAQLAQTGEQVNGWRILAYHPAADTHIVQSYRP